MENNFAEVFTDGSCHTQQLVGAWASVLLIDNQKIVLSGKELDTTHNRMEILAVINSVKYIRTNFVNINEIILVSDSQYVIGLVEREPKFVSSGFKTKAGIDIRNADLVKELLGLLKEITVNFVKIKAHQKPTDAVNYNIEVDKLSRHIVRDAVKKSF
jgi:ribonuclease HI